MEGSRTYHNTSLSHQFKANEPVNVKFSFALWDVNFGENIGIPQGKSMLSRKNVKLMS